MDVTSVSSIVAAGGVIVGVAFAYLEIRSIAQTRKTELIHELYSTLFSKELAEAWEKMRDRELLGYTKYKEKYGLVEANVVTGFYKELTILTYLKLIDINLVYLLFRNSIKAVWEKNRPIVEELRRNRRDPSIDWEFEYLYKEMQKREQTKLQ